MIVIFYSNEKILTKKGNEEIVVRLDASTHINFLWQIKIHKRIIFFVTNYNTHRIVFHKSAYKIASRIALMWESKYCRFLYWPLTYMNQEKVGLRSASLLLKFIIFIVFFLFCVDLLKHLFSKSYNYIENTI